MGARRLRMGAANHSDSVKFEEFVTWWTANSDDMLVRTIDAKLNFEDESVRSGATFAHEIGSGDSTPAIGIKGNSKATGVLFG